MAVPVGRKKGQGLLLLCMGGGRARNLLHTCLLLLPGLAIGWDWMKATEGIDASTTKRRRSRRPRGGRRKGVNGGRVFMQALRCVYVL